MKFPISTGITPTKNCVFFWWADFCDTQLLLVYVIKFQVDLVWFGCLKIKKITDPAIPQGTNISLLKARRFEDEFP